MLKAANLVSMAVVIWVLVYGVYLQGQADCRKGVPSGGFTSKSMFTPPPNSGAPSSTEAGGAR